MKLEEQLRQAHICYDKTAHNQGIMQSRYEFIRKLTKPNSTFDVKKGYEEQHG
jgi:hypothetical protein